MGDSSDFAENFETKKAILRIVGRGQRYQEQLEVVFCEAISSENFHF